MVADVGLVLAFGGGLVSFLSPCVLPLVPAYLSIVAGLAPGELRGEELPLAQILPPAPGALRTVRAAGRPVRPPAPRALVHVDRGAIDEATLRSRMVELFGVDA